MPLARASDELHMATGVADDDPLRASAGNVLHFRVENRLGSFGLDDVVDACAATTTLGHFQFDELDAGDALEQIARWFDDFLNVPQVARIGVGDARFHSAGGLDAQIRCQKFGNVLDLCREFFGFFEIHRIIVKEMRDFVFERRAATARVRDDGVIVAREERVNVASRQFARERVFALVDVRRTAARLPGGKMYFVAIALQHANRRFVHLSEKRFLDATDEERHLAAFFAEGWRGRAIIAIARLDGWQNRFHRLERLGEVIERAHDFLNTGDFVQPHHARHQFQQSEIWHQLTQTQPTDESLDDADAPIQRDGGLRGVNQDAVLNAGGTRGLARAARKAQT